MVSALEFPSILKDGTKSHTSSLDYCLNKDVKICEGSTEPVLPGPGSQRGLGEGGSLEGNTIYPRPSPLCGPRSSAHAIRTESYTCIKGFKIDEPKDADLTTNDDTENDTTAAPPDVQMTYLSWRFGHHK